ncbi:MAG TPA: DUF3305 domain-containing protein [Usitatibacteraceae bacterium]|jgi:hypothetical protein|nr:DUF3305 domain-containing protein [Usitatibacteraceae bacterium]
MSDKPQWRLGLVIERIPFESRWASHRWVPVAVIPDPGGEPSDVVEGDRLRRTFPGLVATVHLDEAEGYYLNTTSGETSLFALLREDEATGEPAPLQVTLSYNEAARWMDASERVERVPVDAALAEWLAAWVAGNYRPEKKERQRPKSFKGKEGRLRARDA